MKAMLDCPCQYCRTDEQAIARSSLRIALKFPPEIKRMIRFDVMIAQAYPELLP